METCKFNRRYMISASLLSLGIIWALMGNKLMISGLFPLVFILSATFIVYLLAKCCPKALDVIMPFSAAVEMVAPIVFAVIIILNALNRLEIDWTPANLVGTLDILGLLLVLTVDFLFHNQRRHSIAEITSYPENYKHLIPAFRCECIILQGLAVVSLIVWCIAFWYLNPETVMPSFSDFGILLMVYMLFFSCGCSIENVLMQTDMGYRKIDYLRTFLVALALSYHIAFMVGTLYALRMNIVRRILVNARSN